MAMTREENDNTRAHQEASASNGDSSLESKGKEDTKEDNNVDRGHDPQKLIVNSDIPEPEQTSTTTPLMADVRNKNNSRKRRSSCISSSVNSINNRSDETAMFSRRSSPMTATAIIGQLEETETEAEDCKSKVLNTPITMETSGIENDSTKERCNARWENMFQRLLNYRDKNGHCLVPNRFAEDPQLGAWVATQRRFYKMKQSGNGKSALTSERETRLIEAGFEWSAENSRCVPWNTRFVELLEFVAKNGHAQVPIGWEDNIQLSNWVSTQRQEYKSLQKGKRSSTLNGERIKMLNCIGFVWVAQRGGPRRQRKAGRVLVPECSSQTIGGMTPAIPEATSSAHRSAAICLLQAFRRTKGGMNTRIEDINESSNERNNNDRDGNSEVSHTMTSPNNPTASSHTIDASNEQQRKPENEDKKLSAVDKLKQVITETSATPMSAHLPVALLPIQGITQSPYGGIVGFAGGAGGLPSSSAQNGLHNMMLGAATTPVLDRGIAGVGATANPGNGAAAVSPWQLLPSGVYQQQQLRNLSNLSAATLGNSQTAICHQQFFPIATPLVGASTIPNILPPLPNLGLSITADSISANAAHHHLNAAVNAAVTAGQQQQQQQNQQQIMNVLALVSAAQRAAANNHSDQTVSNAPDSNIIGESNNSLSK